MVIQMEQSREVFKYHLNVGTLRQQVDNSRWMQPRRRKCTEPDQCKSQEWAHAVSVRYH